MVIYLRVDILPKRLTLSHPVHILHRKPDEIFLSRPMVEHLALITRSLDVQIIMGQIRISSRLFHCFFLKYRRMKEFHSMVMDPIFVTGSMLKIIVMQSGKFLLEQNQRAFIMLVVITNIRIWKSQRFSYNFSENLKILFHLSLIAQVMTRDMQLMQRKSEMNLVGVQSFDLKKV